MMGFVLTIVCFSGFIYASRRWLKIDVSNAPIFSVSLIGILLFFSAVTNHLKAGTQMLIYAGFVLSGICLIDAWFHRKSNTFVLPVRQFTVLFSLIAVSFIVTIGMKFTVIDDYVYWGIIGKYLFLNHHLPDQHTTIIARHLSYTPGTSLFHYLFYTLAGEYSPRISYFAQALLLISSLFVVIKKELLKKTVVCMCILVILLILFSGSVFTKLQVDYLLSVFFFAVLWIYFHERPSKLTLFTISLPVCFLFLIKEIGFVLGVLILVIVFFDLVLNDNLTRKEKIRATAIIFFTGGVLFLLRQTWVNHCQLMGFVNFDSAVTIESIKQSLNIIDSQKVQKGFGLFIKGITLGPADRLNLPYILWFGTLIFLWVKIFSKAQARMKKRYSILLTILTVSFVIYLFMLYFMQIIIFGVGDSNMSVVGLTRYLNILFAQVVFFTILMFVDTHFFNHRIPNSKVAAFITITLLALGISRAETTIRREDHFKTAEQIAEQIAVNIDTTEEISICVVPGNNDDHLGIKLLYHLLPGRINYTPFPEGDQAVFTSNLLQYDYAFVNHPSEKIRNWITPVISEPFEGQGFFKIIPARDQGSAQEPVLALEKIF